MTTVIPASRSAAPAPAPPPLSPKRDNPVGPADEIDLLAYATTVARGWRVLLVVVVAVAAVTYMVSRQMAPTYEARFRLMGTETGLQDTPGSNLNMVGYRALVESPTQVAALLAEFKLHGPPHNVTPSRFLRNHVDVDLVRDSSIIEVAVRLSDPSLLVTLSRRYAERVVEAAQQLNTEGIDFTIRQIKSQRDAALASLNAANSAFETYQRQTQIELLRKDVDSLLLRRPDALNLTVKIEGARARLRQAETELAAQDKIRGVRRSIDNASNVTPGLERNAPARPEKDTVPAPVKPDDLRIRGELLDPYVNPVYEALSRDVGEYRAELAGLERERKELIDRLQLSAPSSDKLARLYAAQAQMDVLARERDLAREFYLNAAKKFEDARLQSTIRSPRLQLLDAPQAPDAPVGPRSVRNSLVAALLAFTFAAIALIALSTRQTAREVA